MNTIHDCVFDHREKLALKESICFEEEQIEELIKLCFSVKQPISKTLLITIASLQDIVYLKGTLVGLLPPLSDNKAQHVISIFESITPGMFCIA